MTGNLISGLGSALGGLQTYLIVGAATALIAGAGGAYAGYRWELGKYETLVASDATQMAAAESAVRLAQKAIYDANQQVTAADAQAQAKIVTNTVTVTKEIPVYVHDQVSCPGGTYGFVRLLYAAEQGVDPAGLKLPAGVTDDTCSPDEPSDLAARLAEDFGDARGNAQQLSDLIGAVTRNDAIAAALPAVPR